MNWWTIGWVKIRTPIQDNYFLVDFMFGIRNDTKSSHIEPYFAADTLYKIQLWTLRSQLLKWSLLIGPKLDLIKGVRSKIRLYVRTFSMIPDPTQKIYKEIFVLDGDLDFHPP